MSINRIHRRSAGFSVIQNEAVQSKTLSWRANGILWYLLSTPDTWEAKTSYLVAEFPGGRDAILSAFSELEKDGYLVRWQGRGEDGRFIHKNEIFETLDQRDKWLTQNPQISRAGEAGAGKAGVGFSGRLINTDSIITDRINTDQKKASEGFAGNSEFGINNPTTQLDRIAQPSEQDPDRTPPSSAAPSPPPPDPTRDRLTNHGLPLWRSGNGPNAWVPEIIDEIHADLSGRMPDLFKSRSDTIGWIAKRDKTTHDEHAVLIEKAREAAARIANRAKQTTPANGPTLLQMASAIDDYRRYEFSPQYPPNSYAEAEDWDAMPLEEQRRRAEPYLKRYLNETPDPSLPS
jgi:hypothetical protein